MSRVKGTEKQTPEGKLPVHLSVSHWAAQLEIASALCSDSYFNTDPALWDRFVNHHLSAKLIKAQSMMPIEIRAASFSLIHPTKPDAKPAIEYLRQLSREHSLREDVSELPPAGIPANISYQDMFHEARQVAESAGLLQDAAWLERTALRLFGPHQQVRNRRKLNLKYRDRQ